MSDEITDNNGRDGIVTGTAGDDTIDIGYTGDPDGDMVDNGDAILPGAGPEDDIILAGPGDDVVFAGEGDDGVIGGDGSDTIEGGAGNDVIDSSSTGLPLPDLGYPGLFPADADPEDDRDYVDGGAGDDTITTGDDRDTIDGGDGNDVIDGGIDQDIILGGDGDDMIIGGEGSDTITGGADNDTIYGGLGPGFPDSLNITDDGSDGNPIGPDAVPDNGADLIDGGSGNDLIFGQDDDDTITGGSGDDTIFAGIDDDVVEGGSGADRIIGGQGADTLLGNDDRDLFLGGNPGDVVVGGEGGDDYDTLNLGGSGPVTIEYDPTDPEAGTVTFYDGGGFDPGNIVGTMTFSEIENVVPCFTPGSLIATPKGEVPVESLRAGDKVITRDNGIQEIRWMGSRMLNHLEMQKAPHLRPILIKAGSLGNGLPDRDMKVSPQHRMLVTGERTSLYFEDSEVLVAAKHLVTHGGISWLTTMRTTYIHFMFDQHEVVLADGTWTESFQPGDMTLGGMGDAQRNEIFELFPDLRLAEGRDNYVAARRVLKGHEARLLAL